MTLVTAGSLGFLLATSVSVRAAERRPNIVMIVADDMGYSDIGAFGSEISTPNLDALADRGLRFTQFYTHASCSPTRSMLLSGVDTHVNGLGNMSEWTAPNQLGSPGYEGYLNHSVATLPELLKESGYHTYMTGKWHLGKAPDLIPAARGFERDFALLDGGGSYWDMTNVSALSPRSVFTEDGRYLTRLPSDYYATRTYTDKIIDYIESDRGDGKPFFAYVAHQAPHDPYHLPREWRDRHVAEYDKGWELVRQERLKRQIELGLVPPGTKLAERMWFVPDPIVLAPAPRAVLGRKMELYAGMMENLDHHVGRLVDYLKQIGEYDNTVFVVFGDNGAEGTDLFADDRGHPWHAQLPLRREELVADCAQSMGGPRLLHRLRADVGAGLDDALQHSRVLAQSFALAAVVGVHVYVAAELSEGRLARALAETERIFAPGDIELRFDVAPAIPKTRPLVTVVIQSRPARFEVNGCSRDRHDHRLGHTHINGRRITLWSEQVSRGVDGSWDRIGVPDIDDTLFANALGRVLAHELGHLLLRLNGHRDRGLMRPAFSHRSLTARGRHAFRLSGEDLEEIRETLGR